MATTTRFLVLAGVLAAAALAPAQDAAPENPDAKFPDGQPLTEALEEEGELGFALTKRSTRDCVVAIVGSDADAKELAKFAVRASQIARSTWPAERREQPLDGPRIPIYSVPYGDELEAWLNAVVKPRRVDDQMLATIRAQHYCYWQDLPPFVYAERNKALKIHTKDQGSHVAHGLGHAFFTATARIGMAASPVWMAEGYTCWLDRQVMPKVRIGCVPVHILGGYVKRKDWDQQVTNLVRSGNDPPFSAIIQAKKPDDLREAMVPKAASMCGWLARTRTAEFWKLPHAIGALGPEEGIKVVLGKTVAEIEAEWRAWVPTVKAPVLGGEAGGAKDDGDDGKDD